MQAGLLHTNVQQSYTHYTEIRMKHILTAFIALLALTATGCKESDNTYDPYTNWQARNAVWFAQAADTARTEIAKAKALYGSQWEGHCKWRMYKSLLRSQDLPGASDDSIVCKIMEKGRGTVCPASTDSVTLHFRGWLMPAQYETAEGGTETYMKVFTQTYFGDFDPLIAAPQQMYVGGTVEGFQTALQYMAEGDDWMVYIPAKLAYNEKSSNAIPAYSTLLYHLYIEKVISK